MFAVTHSINDGPSVFENQDVEMEKSQTDISLIVSDSASHRAKLPPVEICCGFIYNISVKVYDGLVEIVPFETDSEMKSIVYDSSDHCSLYSDGDCWNLLT